MKTRTRTREVRADITDRDLNQYKVLDNGCWLWTGPVMSTGYPGVYWPTTRYALLSPRKYLFEQRLGHPVASVGCSCGERLCVNPDHAVPYEDVAQAIKAAHAAKRTVKREISLAHHKARKEAKQAAGRARNATLSEEATARVAKRLAALRERKFDVLDILQAVRLDADI